MSAAADKRFDDEFLTVDARVGSVLESAAQCVRTLGLAGPPLQAAPPAAAHLLDPQGRLDLSAIDVDVGWRLPRDLCRLLRLLPVWRDDEGVITVAVDSHNAELARKLLERHPQTQGAPRYDFLTVSRAELNGAIDLVHGPPPALAVVPAPEPQEEEQPAAAGEETAVAEAVEAPEGAQAAPEEEAEAEEAQIRQLEELWAADAVIPAPPAPVAPAQALPAEVPGPIGARLVQLGVVTQAQVDEALGLQQRYGGRIGEVLIHELGADEAAVSSALAAQLGCEFCSSIEPDPAVADLVDETLVHRHRLLPLSVTGSELRLAMVDPLDEQAIAAVRNASGLRPRPVVVTESEHDRVTQAVFATRYADHATNALLRELPEQCARQTLTHAQKTVVVVVAIAGAIALAISPINALIAFNIVTVGFYLSFSAYRLMLIYNALGHGAALPISEEDVNKLDQRRLPVYTILVPLYREAAVVQEIIAGIQGLDYPKWKLDVKLLCEADDSETIAAIERLQPPPYFHLVVVPDGQPKTKPKACNYGLQRAHGELVVIYDAEDRPDSDQLKQVVAAFAKSDVHVVCVQCKLNYYNQDQNLLTRWFTTEYSMWFDLFLPGLDSVDAPIPLGGTSNHFVTAQLRELGAWDPFNVTEDADLGIRLTRAGYSTEMIDSTTYEEANPLMSNWIRQRSRWVKGYIQTWLVHMRHPIELGRALGWRRFWSFQFVVGGTFIGFLLNPLYWTLTTLWVFTEAGVIREIYPSLLYFAAVTGLYVGNFVFVYINAAGAMWRGYDRLVKYALFTPLYWGLMSIAAWKGAVQLIRHPHYWEKTVHGLSEMPRAADVPARRLPADGG